jgi:hypothetical protein
LSNWYGYDLAVDPKEDLGALESLRVPLHLVFCQTLEVLTVGGSGTEEECATNDVIHIAVFISQGSVG